MNKQAETVLKTVAQTLNEGRFVNNRWAICLRVNEKLQAMDIPLCLFDHGGIADVGHCEILDPRRVDSALRKRVGR